MAEPYPHNTYHFLRFLFACMVFFSHGFTLYGIGYDPVGVVADYLSIGLIALYGFFFLSGHLVSQSWLSDPQAGRFLARRALRIYPALIVVTCATVFLFGPLLTSLPLKDYWAHNQTWSYLCNILLFPKLFFTLPGILPNNPLPFNINEPLYTLPYEVLAYGSVALLGALGLLRRWVIAVLILCALGVYTYKFVLYPNWIVDFSRPWRGLEFRLFGTLGYYFLAGVLYTLTASYWPKNSFIAPVALVTMMLTFEWKWNIYLTAILWPLTVVSLGHLPFEWMRRWTRGADFSYGIYLWGFVMQQTTWALWGLKLSFLEYMLLSFGMTLGAATLSWYCIEKPFLRLKPKKDPKAAIHSISLKTDISA